MCVVTPPTAGFIVVNFLSRDVKAETMSEAKDGVDALGQMMLMPQTTAQRRPGVVVYVKNQHRPQHPQQHRYPLQMTAAAATGAGGELAADSASNTDSGNGTSEYSDDPSPPLISTAAARRHYTTARDPTSTVIFSLSPVSIQTQALALASSQSWLPLLRPSIPIGWRLRLLSENFKA